MSGLLAWSQTFFCPVLVLLMFGSINGIPAEVRPDSASVRSEIFVWVASIDMQYDTEDNVKLNDLTAEIMRNLLNCG